MSEQSEVDELSQTDSQGYGDRLKSAREAKNLTISDIASDLRLDVGMIRALEDYDYAALPEPMFVCGYIRNYARLLNLPAEPLVELYKNEIQGNLIPVLDVKNESRKMRSYRLGKLLPFIFLLLFAALIFAAWQWWQGISSENNGFTATSWFDFIDKSKDQGIQTEADETDELGDPNQLQLPSYSEEPLLPQINESNNNPSHEKEPMVRTSDQLSAVRESSVEVQLLSPAAVPENFSIATIETSTQEQPVHAEAAVSVETAVDDVSIPVVDVIADTPVQDNKLILDFNSDSWVRIKDADGKVLARDLQKKGTHLQLEGKRPYNVFLGDATGVRVMMNNTVFDHSGFINKKKIARFEVE